MRTFRNPAHGRTWRDALKASHAAAAGPTTTAHPDVGLPTAHARGTPCSVRKSWNNLGEMAVSQPQRSKLFTWKRREEALRFHVNSFDRWGWDTAISPRLFHDFLTEHGVPRA